jgi:hypothetical protein
MIGRCDDNMRSMRNGELFSHVRGAVSGIIVWSVAGPSLASVPWLPVVINWTLAITAICLVAMVCVQVLFSIGRRCLRDLQKS